MDTNLVLRTGASDFTGDETLTDVELFPMIDPLYLHVIVPEVSTDDVLDVTADFEDASNNTLQQTTIPQISEAGHYVVPLFCDHPDLTDLSVILNATATGSQAMDFGALKVYISNSRHS